MEELAYLAIEAVAGAVLGPRFRSGLLAAMTAGCRAADVVTAQTSERWKGVEAFFAEAREEARKPRSAPATARRSGCRRSPRRREGGWRPSPDHRAQLRGAGESSCCARAATPGGAVPRADSPTRAPARGGRGPRARAGSPVRAAPGARYQPPGASNRRPSARCGRRPLTARSAVRLEPSVRPLHSAVVSASSASARGASSERRSRSRPRSGWTLA